MDRALRPRAPRRSPEAVLLAAIHVWASSRSPRLARLHPWAVPLSDRAIVAVVPAGAGASPVTVARQGLRSNSLAFGGPPDEGGASVVRVDPRDGSTGVFRDAPVVVRLSHATGERSLTPGAFRVEDPEGALPGRVALSPDGLVLVWHGERAMVAGVPHFVVVSGLRDLRGREFAPHLSRFVPCDVGWGDIADQ